MGLFRDGKSKRKNNAPENVERETLKEKLADVLDISKELVLDVPKITFIGQKELTVENYKSVIEYGPTNIRIAAAPKNISFEGREMEIKTITQELIIIEGYIDCMRFL